MGAGRVPGPALGAGASLGPGTHPFLPWRNSQSREEPDQGKQKAIPSGEWIWWKRHWIWQERCLWELCSWPCDRAATAEILPLGPAGTVHFVRERRGAALGRLAGPGSARRARRACGGRWPGRAEARGARLGRQWAQRPPCGESRARRLAPPARAARGWGADETPTRVCSPKPSPLGERPRGGASPRVGAAGGPSGGGPGEEWGRGLGCTEPCSAEVATGSHLSYCRRCGRCRRRALNTDFEIECPSLPDAFSR